MTDVSELIELLKDEQHKRCAYNTRQGDGKTCDCKFGSAFFGTSRGEMTGCPELREAIRVLELPEHDHTRCCLVCSFHSTPHRGCILR